MAWNLWQSPGREGEVAQSLGDWDGKDFSVISESSEGGIGGVRIPKTTSAYLVWHLLWVWSVQVIDEKWH